MQIDDEFLPEPSRKKKADILESLDVPADLVRKYATFSIAEIEQLFQEVRDLIETGDEKLLWNGYGSYPQIISAMEVVWGRLTFDKHQVRTPKQFAHFSNKLRKRKSINDFLTAVVRPDNADDDLDLAFNFLKGAEYSFSKPLSLLEGIIHAVLRDEHTANYQKFLSDLVSWSLPNNLKCLEELGVPTPIIERVRDDIDQFDPDAALNTIRVWLETDSPLKPEDKLVLKYTLA